MAAKLATLNVFQIKMAGPNSGRPVLYSRDLEDYVSTQLEYTRTIGADDLPEYVS